MHMEHRDVAFTKRYKIYMADFLEWAREAEDSEAEYIIDDIDLVLMTFQDDVRAVYRHHVYSRGEVLDKCVQPVRVDHHFTQGEPIAG